MIPSSGVAFVDSLRLLLRDLCDGQRGVLHLPQQRSQVAQWLGLVRWIGIISEMIGVVAGGHRFSGPGEPNDGD